MTDMQAAASAANLELVASAGDRGEATLEARMPLGVIVFAMTQSNKQTLLGIVPLRDRTAKALAATPKSCPRPVCEGSAVLFCRLSLLVDCRLGDFGERLVRGLFLIKRFLKQFDGVIQTEFFRPGL
jgi:hypothetical protein